MKRNRRTRSRKSNDFGVSQTPEAKAEVSIMQHLLCFHYPAMLVLPHNQAAAHFS